MAKPLPDDRHPIVAAVRRFVEKDVKPVAAALEHDDLYPHDLVLRMRELGLFGALIPKAYAHHLTSRLTRSLVLGRM